MGSDGVMQALIKGWEMFSLWFNLVLLNYINMYRRSHTHTQKSCYISIPSQSGGLKQRKERLDYEDGFPWAFKSAHVKNIFIVGHTEPLMSSWRASWLKLCCLRGHTLFPGGRWDRFYVQSWRYPKWSRTGQWDLCGCVNTHVGPCEAQVLQRRGSSYLRMRWGPLMWYLCLNTWNHVYFMFHKQPFCTSVQLKHRILSILKT